MHDVELWIVFKNSNSLFSKRTLNEAFNGLVFNTKIDKWKIRLSCLQKTVRKTNVRFFSFYSFMCQIVCANILYVILCFLIALCERLLQLKCSRLLSHFRNTCYHPVGVVDVAQSLRFCVMFCVTLFCVNFF